MANITLTGAPGAGEVYAGNTHYAAPSAALTVSVDVRYLDAFLAAGYTFATVPLPIANGGTAATSAAAARLALGLYAGYVGSNGTTGNVLPTGWSAASASTGLYVITHNLGLSGAAKLSLTMTPVDASVLTDVPVFAITAEDANTTTIKIVSDVATPAVVAHAFYFRAQVI